MEAEPHGHRGAPPLVRLFAGPRRDYCGHGYGFRALARSDDKKRVRLNIISHLLGQIPYKSLPHKKIKLPPRQKPGVYKELDYPVKYVPEIF